MELEKLKGLSAPNLPAVGSGIEPFLGYLNTKEDWEDSEASRLKLVKELYDLELSKINQQKPELMVLPEVIKEYNIALYESIKKKVPKFALESDRPRNLAYFCSSCDFHTPLLVTNAEYIDCFDLEWPIRPADVYLAILELYTKNGIKEINQETKEALEYRRIQGHFRTDLNQKANPNILLAHELVSLGVEFDGLNIEEKKGVNYPLSPWKHETYFEVRFKWKHPKDNVSKERVVSLVGVDVDTWHLKSIHTATRQKEHGFRGGGFDFFILKSAHRTKNHPDYLANLHKDVLRMTSSESSSLVFIGDQFGLENDNSQNSIHEMKQKTQAILEHFLSKKDTWEYLNQPPIEILKKATDYFNQVAHLLPLEQKPDRLRQRSYSWLMFTFVSKGVRRVSLDK